MDRKLLDYYPAFLQEIKELDDLCRAQQPTIEEADTQILKAIDECYIETATQYGISRMEKIMGIRPAGEDEVEERRFRVKLMLGNPEFYTMRKLKKILGNLLGENGYSIELVNDNYTLKVRVELSVKGKFDDALRYVKGICPANIVIDMDLLYNQHVSLKQFTHKQFMDKTYEQIRKEVL